MLTLVPRTSLPVNGDKGPFRAAVSGLKSSRDRALAVALAGPFDSGLSPSSLHDARVLPAGALLRRAG